MPDKGLISKAYKRFIELNQKNKPSTTNELKTLTDISPKKKYRWPVGFPGGASGKEPACQRRRHERHRFNPRVGKIRWWRAWQPTPVFLPGESHGQRSLVGFIVHRVAKSQTLLKQLSTQQVYEKMLNITNKEMKIRTTVRYYLTLVRMAIIKK